MIHVSQAFPLCAFVADWTGSTIHLGLRLRFHRSFGLVDRRRLHWICWVSERAPPSPPSLMAAIRRPPFPRSGPLLPTFCLATRRPMHYTFQKLRHGDRQQASLRIFCLLHHCEQKSRDRHSYKYQHIPSRPSGGFQFGSWAHRVSPDVTLVYQKVPSLAASRFHEVAPRGPTLAAGGCRSDPSWVPWKKAPCIFPCRGDLGGLSQAHDTQSNTEKHDFVLNLREHSKC